MSSYSKQREKHKHDNNFNIRNTCFEKKVIYRQLRGTDS